MSSHIAVNVYDCNVYHHLCWHYADTILSMRIITPLISHQRVHGGYSLL